MRAPATAASGTDRIEASREACEYLAWDSVHFALRIGRVKGGRLSPPVLAEIGDWGMARSMDCLYFLAEPEPETLRLAAAQGWRFVDARCSFEVALSDHPAATLPANVRPARAEDVAALRSIAGESHHSSRFYADGNFPVARCDELYRVWIERSCLDRSFATEVLVAESDSRAIGYISYLLCSTTAEIGLVGVDSRFRGRGLGSQLVGAALLRVGAAGGRLVRVVTQGSNLQAQRLYQGLGFRPSSIGFWYHLWSEPAGAAS